MEEVFLKPVAGHEELGSLVYEEGDRITGFLGSAPRPMTLDGRPVITRIATQFAVHPRSRGIPGLKLLQAFFAGPQDFAIADESNTLARNVWQGLGAATSPVHSLLWIYPLRPWSFGLYALGKFRRKPPPVPHISKPLAKRLDAVTSGLNPFRMATPVATGRELDLECLSACLAGMTDRSLRPCYDTASLAWVLRRAEQTRTSYPLQKFAVTTDKGQIAGWYIFSVTNEGIAEVLQFHARSGFVQRVLGHLLHRAKETGAVAAAGRFDHGLMEAVSEARCLLCSGPWMLVHSRNPEFVRAFERGDVFFSRLEGDWCLRFQ